MRPDIKASHKGSRRSQRREIISRLNFQLIYALRQRSWSSWQELFNFKTNCIKSDKELERKEDMEKEDISNGHDKKAKTSSHDFLDIGPSVSRIRATMFHSCCFDEPILIRCSCGLVVKRETFGTHQRLRHDTQLVHAAKHDWKILNCDAGHKMKFVRVSPLVPSSPPRVLVSPSPSSSSTLPSPSSTRSLRAEKREERRSESQPYSLPLYTSKATLESYSTVPGKAAPEHIPTSSHKIACEFRESSRAQSSLKVSPELDEKATQLASETSFHTPPATISSSREAKSMPAVKSTHSHQSTRETPQAARRIFPPSDAVSVYTRHSDRADQKRAPSIVIVLPKRLPPATPGAPATFSQHSAHQQMSAPTPSAVSSNFSSPPKSLLTNLAPPLKERLAMPVLKNETNTQHIAAPSSSTCSHSQPLTVSSRQSNERVEEIEGIRNSMDEEESDVDDVMPVLECSSSCNPEDSNEDDLPLATIAMKRAPPN